MSKAFSENWRRRESSAGSPFLRELLEALRPMASDIWQAATEHAAQHLEEVANEYDGTPHLDGVRDCLREQAKALRDQA